MDNFEYYLTDNLYYQLILTLFGSSSAKPIALFIVEFLILGLLLIITFFKCSDVLLFLYKYFNNNLLQGDLLLVVLICGFLQCLLIQCIFLYLCFYQYKTKTLIFLTQFQLVTLVCSVLIYLITLIVVSKRAYN